MSSLPFAIENARNVDLCDPLSEFEEKILQTMYYLREEKKLLDTRDTIYKL